MLPIYEIPPMIHKMYDCYRDCFSTETEYVYFLRYMTGLLVPGKATVDGINKLFCGELARDQSNANRFLTGGVWEPLELEQRRVDTLKRHPMLRPGKRGIIAIDDMLLEKTGEQMEGVGWLRDTSQGKDVLCHCLVTCTYNKLGQSYPLYIRPYFKQAVCESEEGQALGLAFRSKVELALELVRLVLSEGIRGVFVFDAWYLSQRLVSEVEGADRLWLSRLKGDRLIKWSKTGPKCWQAISSVAKQVPKKAYHQVTLDGQVFWCYVVVVEVHQLEGSKKVMVVWREEIGKGDPFFIVTNATWWDAKRMLLVYFGRWPIEEWHREGKQHEGLADYQMRRLDGIERHWCLVTCAYAGLVSKAVYSLRGVPHLLTLHSYAMDVVTEIAISFAKRIWEKATQGVESFLSIRWELEAFYDRFKLLSSKRCDPLPI